MVSEALDYRYLDATEYEACLKSVKGRAHSVHGVSCTETWLPSHETGRFDGLEIRLRRTLDSEMKLFVFLHIFGHVVQWNLSARWRQVGLERFGPHNVNDEVLGMIASYERQASAYGLALLHESGVRRLDQWLADWCDADWRYLRGLYLEGKKPDPENAFKERYLCFGRPPLSPKEIPPFQPRRWEERVAF